MTPEFVFSSIIDSLTSYCISAIEGKIKLWKDNKELEEKIDATEKEIIDCISNNEKGKAFSVWLKTDFRVRILDFDSKNRLYSSFKEIERLFTNEFKALGLSEESSKKASTVFINSILNFIKEKKPTDYFEYKFDYLENVINGCFKQQEEQLCELTQFCNEFSNVEQIDLYLREQTNNPSIGLSFFSTDDNDFRTNLLNSMESPSINIQYYSLEEAVYIIACTLLEEKVHKPILVVKNKASWENLSKKIEGAILIPAFYDENIDYIPNNTNIFVSTEKRSNQICLNRRSLSYIEKKLVGFGATSDRSLTIISKTKGYFYLIKEELFIGYNNAYKKSQKSSKEITTLLLFPKWKQYDGDCFLISRIYGDSYDVFKQNLIELRNGETPFIRERNSFGDRWFEVISIVQSWCYFSYLVSEELFKKFLSLCLPCFSSSLLKDSNFKTDNSTLMVSAKLKQGIIDSLCFLVNVINPEWQHYIDDFVIRVLEKALSEGNIQSFLCDSYYLIELSPKSFFEFLEKNKASLSGFFNYDNVNNSSVFPSIDYSLETGIRLTDGKYTLSSLSLAYYFYSKQKGNTNCGPKPGGVVEDFFIPWANFANVSIPEKISIAKNYMEKYKNSFWAILEGALVASSGPGISHPLGHREEKTDFSVTNENYNECINAYLSLLVANGDINELFMLLGDSDRVFPDVKYVNNIVKTIENLINNEDDLGKFTCEKRIRSFIYSQRFFQRKYFLDKEDVLSKIEGIIESISYKNKLYKYLFIIDYSSIYYPILNPSSYNAINRSLNEKENIFKAKEVIHKTYDLMKKEGISIKELIPLVAFEKKTGGSGFDEYGFAKNILFAIDKKFIDGVFDELINNDFIEAAKYYLYHSCPSTDLIESELRKQQNSIIRGFLFCTLDLQGIDVYERLLNEPIDVQKHFWNSETHIVKDKESFNKALETLKGTNQKEKEIYFLINNEGFTNYKIILEEINKSLDTKKKLSNYSEFYYEIHEFLNKHKTEVANSKDLLYIAANIEYSILDPEDYDLYFNKLCALNDPTFYEGILNSLFKKDNGESDNKKTKEEIKKAFDLEWNLRFCPGQTGNGFSEEKFKEWVDKFNGWANESGHLKIKDSVLGKLFSFSPKENDGYPLMTPIRVYIEKNNSQELAKGYEISICNSRGVFSYTEGKDERMLADNYGKISDYFKEKGYPFCSQIYANLRENYLFESNQEKKDSRDGKFDR